MTAKPIKSAVDYEVAVARIEQLMDAVAGTPEGDELDLLATLVDHYESEQFEIEPPTPLAAIRFRMEQDGLTARDLEPYIGSRARVSEVLSGERPLSIDMIRALHRHLGIPAVSLIGVEEIPDLDVPIQPAKPVITLLKKWKMLQPRETYDSFFYRACSGNLAEAMLRKTRTERANAKADAASLQAWCASVMLRSRDCSVTARFDREEITPAVGRTIAQLSQREDGPLAVRDELANLGICFVIFPHLPETYLDGAAMLKDDGNPVIALTLRRDRIDVFWFTLLHELAHVAKHLSPSTLAIFDDLDLKSVDALEREADDWAQEALIPHEAWEGSALGPYASTAQVEALARHLGINPAIIAGRWQREHRDFRKFSRLISHGTLHDAFADELPS